MTHRRALFGVSLVLAATGLGLFLYKVVAMGFPLVPSRMADVWNVEARVSFEARNEPVKASLFIPASSGSLIIESEHFVSRGYGLNTREAGMNRRALWSVRRAKGPQDLYYRAVVYGSPVRRAPKKTRPREVVEHGFEEPHLTAASTLLAEIRTHSADLDTLVSELLKQLHRSPPDDHVALLLGNAPSLARKLETAVRVLALAGIPATTVHGVPLVDQTRNASLVHWVEVYEGQRWRAFDPGTGRAEPPQNTLAWWRGDEPILDVQGGRKVRLSISVNKSPEGGVAAAVARGKKLFPQIMKFSLFSLPVHTQEVYRVLLLVPVGALLLVVFRNVVGVSTFGTFMPVLIALAFRETQLLWGIVLFTVLIGLGLSIRFSLERLNLLLTARLASILTVVVLLMAALSVLTHKLDLQRGLSIALFPMVIITMTIERMSIVWEERGPGEALTQGAGSILVAALAYMAMVNGTVEYLVFVFPELLLLVLAVTLLLGRYTGYRLLELRRFKVFAGEGPR